MKKVFLILFILISVQTIYTQKPIGVSAKSKNKAVMEKRIKDQLIGIWILVLVDNINPNGKRTQPYGENPQGVLTFDKDGNYSLQILGTDRTKFVSGDKTKGTADENKSLVLGSNSHFGKYLIRACRAKDI